MNAKKYILILVVALFAAAAISAFGAEDNPGKAGETENEAALSKHAQDTHSAIGDYKRTGDAKKREKIRKDLKAEKDPYLKSTMIGAFVKDQDQAATNDLVGILKSDPSPEVRRSAARSLGFSKDGAVVPALGETFANAGEDLGVRLEAAKALSMHRSSDASFNALAAGLKDENPVIRYQAECFLFQAFRATRSERIKPALEEMTKDKDAKVADTAKKKLKLLE